MILTVSLSGNVQKPLICSLLYGCFKVCVITLQKHILPLSLYNTPSLIFHVPFKAFKWSKPFKLEVATRSCLLSLLSSWQDSLACAPHKLFQSGDLDCFAFVTDLMMMMNICSANPTICKGFCMLAVWCCFWDWMNKRGVIDSLAVRAFNAHLIILVMAVMTIFKPHLSYLLLNPLIRWPKCV